MSRPGKYIFYFAYSLAAVVFFLFVLFPAESLRGMLLDRIKTIDPNVAFDSEHINLVFPVGLRLSSASLAYAGNPALHLDKITITPSLTSLISKTKKVKFSATIGTGLVEGVAELTDDSQRPQSKVTMNLLSIPLEKIVGAERFPRYTPTGAVDGFIDYDSKRGGAGSATANLELTMAAVALDPPLMGMDRIEFSSVQADLTVTPRLLQIKRCEATGLQFEGKVSGSIRFSRPITSSRIILSGNIKPQPAFVDEHKNDLIGGLLSSPTAQKRGIPFRISGTLEAPKYIPR